MLVTEGRGEVVRIHLAGHGQDGNVAEIPMTFVRVRERVDDFVLVFVTRAAAELGDGTELHQRVGQGRAGKGQSGPHPPRRHEADVGDIGQRRRAEKRIYIRCQWLFGGK